MKLLKDWGFSSTSWQGLRGEYWVLAQIAMLIGFAALPVYRPKVVTLPFLYEAWTVAALFGLFAIILILKGPLDLGRSLTPLPYPKEDGQLVRSGIYGVVRHPLYSGLIAGAFSWAFYQVSLSHLIGTIIVFLFFNAKANREEHWLLQKYPDYPDYQQHVKRLIPWLY